jgi:hypothetical protein
MLPPRFRGPAGEYLWEKEMARLERYKDRPWELQSKKLDGNPGFVLLVTGLGIIGGLMFFSLF